MKEFDDIKEVREGVAYNTRTSMHLGNSTRAVSARGDGRPAALVEQLFRTRGGRYFIAHRGVPARTSNGAKVIDEIEPLSKERAIEWLTMHHPQSHELFLMSLPFVKPTSGEGTTLSVRIDSSLKEGMSMRASIRGCPASTLHTNYLRHGFVNDIDRPLLPPERYTTVDGVWLLNGDGEPAFDGIRDNGGNFEMRRAEVAAAFREGARTIPEKLRLLLLAAIAGPDAGFEANPELRRKMRDTLLSDIARWLELLDRTPTWLKSR